MSTINEISAEIEELNQRRKEIELINNDWESWVRDWQGTDPKTGDPIGGENFWGDGCS